MASGEGCGMESELAQQGVILADARLVEGRLAEPVPAGFPDSGQGKRGGVHSPNSEEAPGAGPTSLLCLLEALGPLPELTAVSGVDEAGSPVLLPLKSRHVWHLLITGPALSGKSEWVRSLAVSLALTSAPERLQIAGIDLGGRELGVLESLPHAVADLATSLDTARALLARLNSEMDRRRREAALKRDLILIVDDLGWAHGPEGTSCAALLGRLWSHGWESGIHILAAGRSEPAFIGGMAARGRAVGGRLGWFDLATGRETARLRACGLSAWGLDRAVRRLGRPLSRDGGSG